MRKREGVVGHCHLILNVFFPLTSRLTWAQVTSSISQISTITLSKKEGLKIHLATVSALTTTALPEGRVLGVLGGRIGFV